MGSQFCRQGKFAALYMAVVVVALMAAGFSLAQQPVQAVKEVTATRESLALT